MASKSEIAYQKIRELILSAGLLPGEHLAEQDWSARLDLGRFAIREALKRLHGEGLVDRTRGKYRIPSITPEEVQEISHVRAVLEIGAMRFLQAPIRSERICAIRELANDYAELVRKRYYDGAREADLRFHRAIIAASENKRLIRLYEQSNLPLLHITIGKTPLDDFEQSAQEHEEICAALESGQMELAAERLQMHLWRGAREVIGGGAPADPDTKRKISKKPTRSL